MTTNNIFTEGESYNITFQPFLSEKGFDAISDYIRFTAKHDIWLSYDDCNGLEYVNKSGKIAKRIKNNLKKRYNISLTNEDVSAIGNIAFNNLENGSYNFTIESDMDVFSNNASDIVKRNTNGSTSCFSPGGCYRHHFVMMDNCENFFAVKFWSEELLVARAWLRLYDNQLYVFNAYGITLPKITNILAKVFDMVEHDNTHMNDRIKSDRLYVNLNTINLLVKKGIEPVQLSFSELIENCEEEEEEETCYNCGESVDEDYCYHDDYHTYCECCYDELYTFCDRCNDTCLREGSRYTNDENVCEYCFDRYYAECEECHCEDSQENMYDENGEYYCEDCHSELFAFCDECGNTCESCNSHDTDNGTLCEDCYKELFISCDECDCDIEKSASHEVLNGSMVLCENCYYDREDIAIQLELSF